MGRCGSLWIVVGRCGSLWVVPCFSNYHFGMYMSKIKAKKCLKMKKALYHLVICRKLGT